MANTPSVPVYTGTGGSDAKAPKSAEDLQKEAQASARAAERRANASARAAERRAVARDNAAKRRAGKRYLVQASNLQEQIDALGRAIKTEFAKNRDTNLGNLDRNLAAQMGVLQQGHNERARQFMLAGEDTAKAAGGTAELGLSNLMRERADAMTNILEQGAGETDAARALLMSARNWQANAAENNRNYFDSMRSVNQGIVDLNVDTRTAMNNAHWQAEQERSRVWQDFYNKKSEAQTQRGNAAGQQADYYANAEEMGVKPKKGAEARSKGTMKNSYQGAADTAGKAYTQKGWSGLNTWKGADEIEAHQENTNLEAALKLGPVAKAEGASLRKWS